MVFYNLTNPFYYTIIRQAAQIQKKSSDGGKYGKNYEG